MIPTTVILLTLVIAMTNALDNNNQDGRYVPDDSGRYEPLYHDGGKYYHDDSGRYIPDYSGLYHPDGLGYYNPDGSGLYKGDNSGQYNPRKYNRFQSNIGRYKAKYSNFNPTQPVKRSKPDRSTEELDEEKINKSFVGRYKPEVKPIIKRKIPRYDGHWKIIRQNGGVGNTGYKYLYETENKILAEEKANVINKGSKDETIESKGYYQYVGDDDVQYKLTYTADENGFIPQGDHLPPSIVRLLEYHKAHG